ncbi:hypothetical protein N9E84_03005, partial [Planktomarina temperata]|nr:hypothetical protein [Planktomarina temperata]
MFISLFLACIVNATSKLVKAWESKNAKNAAKAGGISLMALSLAACGGSSSDEVTVISATAADAGLTDSSATTAAELVLEIKTSDNVEAILNAVTSVDADAITVQDVANLAFGDGVASEAQSIVDEINTLLGTSFTTDDEADTVIAAIVSSDNEELVRETLTANGITYESLEVALASIDPTVNDSGVAADAKSEALTSEAGDEFVSVDEAIISNDAGITKAALTDANGTEYVDVDEAYDTGVQDGKDSRDTEVQGLTDTITAINNTAFDDEQAAYDAGDQDGKDSRDTEVQGLENQIAAFQDIANRTLDADNETIDLTSSTSNTIIVHGEDAGADSLDGTAVTASGVVVFDFTDAADTVVLSAASDLTGVTDIDIQGGTVDFTALGGGVNTLAGVNITAASGSIMTGAQFLAAGSVGGGDMDLVLVLEAGDDVDAILTKLQSGDVALSTTVVQAPDGLLTPAQNATLSGLAGTTVTDLDGGAVSTTNAAPTIASAETTTIDASGAAAALTATAVVTDAEGNYNGGSITISFANAFVEDAGITLAAGDFSFSGTSIIADSNAVEGDDDVIIGSITYNGATDLDTSGGTDTAYESVTINFDSDLVTNDVVTALIADIRIEDPEVEGGAGAVTTDAIVTVTVADASGDSASFSRLVDPSGALALADLDDDGGEIEIEDAAAATIDGGGNAAIDLNGSETVGMTIAFSSTVAGDTFAIENVTGAGLAGQARVIGSNLAYGANDTIIGTVSGNGEASLVITLGTLGGAAEVSNEAIIDDILQGVTATYDTGTAGARDVTTTVTSGNS